ncbi:class I SAM-dependent methyltransferase [Brevundimonas sp. FT23042]|uniref:class I SAM-dependent methyltransferase n=1 Tax=Brevundimonas sp. FT23042 TaxID=3393749 RepID=UPI003B58B2DF
MTGVALHYQRNADRLARAYLDVAFEDVHSALLSYLPAPGSAVADIGAGAGRDARALAARGYEVTAVEPSSAMRRLGEKVSAPYAVDWLADELPDLAGLRRRPLRFDFVLCSAVLMHLAPALLDRAFAGMAAVCARGAVIATTLRPPRPDDPPGVFHDHAEADVVAAARRSGLTLLGRGCNADRLNRQGTAWTWLVFKAG